MTTAIDRLRVRRPAVDHGDTTVKHHGEVPVGATAGIERHGCRGSVTQQVELRPAGGVLDGQSAGGTGVVIRTQPEAAGMIIVERRAPPDVSGMTKTRSYRPPAGRRSPTSLTSPGWLRSRPSTAATRKGVPASANR